MAVVRINALPAGTPTQSKKLAMDLSTAESATIKDIVYAGRPAASQAEAEAGTDADKVMTPVTTKQSIAAQVGVTIASNAQGTKADSALQPAAIGTTVQSYSANLTTLAGVTPGAAGTSMLALTAASNVRSFLATAPYVSTRTALKALDTTLDLTCILTEAGREGIFNWKAGDYSTQVAADTFEGVFVKATAIASSAGTWVRVHDGYLDIQWFGATRATVTQLQSTSLFSAVPDSADNVAAAYAIAAILGADVGGMGAYKTSKMHDIPSGISVIGRGALEGWEAPFFDVPAMTMDRGLTFIMTGTGTRNCSLSYCSNMRYGGAYRVNASRLYTTANDNYLEATDFTNAGASGSTPATPKLFSSMVRTGNDGLSGKVILKNTRWVPRCDDGTNGPLSGYLAVNANAVVAWDEWDVGLYQMTPYMAITEDCQFVGNINSNGLLQTSVRFGNTTSGGRGEMAIYQRNWFSNGVAIRNGDFYFPTAKTASTVTLPVGTGHMVPTSGTIFANSSPLSYTSTTPGAGTLTLNGIADTSGITVGGLSATIIHMTNNNGTTQTVFRDNNIRDFYHTSGLERPNPLFGSQAAKYSAAIELVGYPIRGVTFENNTIYTREPMFLLQMGARNIWWREGTVEPKAYKTTLGGSDNTTISNAIAGPDAANAASWNYLQMGDASLSGYPWSGNINISPIRPNPGGRYAAFTDCFNPGIYDDNGKVYDVRKPERYFVSSGSATFYDDYCAIDTEGGAATDELDNISAVMTVNELTLYSFNSSRITTITEVGNVNLLGQPVRLGGGTSVTLRRVGSNWFLKNRFETRYLETTAVYDPPSLVDGAGSDSFITITGAALGDLCIASFSLNTAGITVTSNVVNANTVRVRFQNETGGTLDLASGTLRVRVWK